MIRNSLIVRTSSSESSTPNGRTEAPVASSAAWSVYPHPQPIVEVVHDAVAGPQPARRLRPRPDDGGRVCASAADSARFIAVPVVPEVRCTRAIRSSGAAR